MPHEVTGVEHVGIAVTDVAAALDAYRALGFTRESVEDLTEQGVRSHILRCGEIALELLEPLGAGTPLARFLDARGGGLHHLCLRVRSLDDTIEQGRAAGFRFTSAAPSTDRRGRRIFVHPQSTGGVLVGLVQVHDDDR